MVEAASTEGKDPKVLRSIVIRVLDTGYAEQTTRVVRALSDRGTGKLKSSNMLPVTVREFKCAEEIGERTIVVHATRNRS